MRHFGREQITRSIAISDELWRIVERWSSTTGLSCSEVVRMLIEEHSDNSLQWESPFGWQFKPPKWKEQK